jgi:hypothetical protein
MPSVTDQPQTTGTSPLKGPPDWRENGYEQPGQQRDNSVSVRSPWNSDAPGWNCGTKPEPVNKRPRSPWTTTPFRLAVP